MDEIDGVTGLDEDYRITMKDIAEMKYLECCIKEALRLYPSVPVIARKISEDINIGKFHNHCLYVWSQVCVVTSMCGHKYVWSQDQRRH
jgi:hypothetical protein